MLRPPDHVLEFACLHATCVDVVIQKALQKHGSKDEESVQVSHHEEAVAGCHLAHDMQLVLHRLLDLHVSKSMNRELAAGGQRHRLQAADVKTLFQLCFIHNQLPRAAASFHQRT